MAGAVEEEEEEVVEKPAPIKISVQEVLNRVKKPNKKHVLKSASTINKKGT